MVKIRPLKIAVYNIKKWCVNPRIYIIFVLLTCYIHYMEKPIKSFSEYVNINISPYLFPFLISSGYSSKIILLLLILLFCDAPFMENEYPYIAIRSGRKKWCQGQQAYIGIASAIYVIFIVMSTVIVMIPNISFEWGWGKVINTFAQTGTAAQKGIMIPFDFNIVQNYSPILIMMLQLLLCWLEFVTIGNLMFLLNILSSRATGAVVATGLVFFQIFAESIAVSWTYFSPTSWMSLSFISINGIGERPSLSYALITLVAINLFLLAASFKIASRKDIEVLKNI